MLLEESYYAKMIPSVEDNRFFTLVGVSVVFLFIVSTPRLLIYSGLYGSGNGIHALTNNSSDTHVVSSSPI